MDHHFKFYPYKLRSINAKTDDKIKLLEFDDFIVNYVKFERILRSDEANFSLEGSVNKHNAIIWGARKTLSSSASTTLDTFESVLLFSREFKLKPFF